MKRKQAYHALLLMMIAATLPSSAWWSLHHYQALILRDQPLLQLTPQQQKQLQALDMPLTVEVYARNNPQLRRSISDLIAPFKLWVRQLQIRFINPDTDPVRVQEHDITREGQLYLTDGKRGRRIDIAAPQTLANALLDFSAGDDINIVHLQGHGERAYISDTAGNWKGFYQRLRSPHIHIADQDQNTMPDIADNTDLLVIADPENISPKQGSALQKYLGLGGSLLYTTDTRHPYLPPWLNTLTGLRLVPGKVVDAAARGYGFNDPQMLVIDTLGDHPITKTIRQAPLLPTAVAFEDDPKHPPTTDWKRSPLLWSSPESWSEQGDLHAAALSPGANERRGPLALAWILERRYRNKPQYIVLLGDSDIFQENYLPVGGNAQFLDNLTGYLAAQSNPGNVAPPVLKDQYITLPEQEKLPLSVTLIFILPLLALLSGWILSWQNKRKYR